MKRIRATYRGKRDVIREACFTGKHSHTDVPVGLIRYLQQNETVRLTHGLTGRSISEIESKSKLHLPGIPCRGELTQAGVHLVASRVEACGRVEEAELRMVERVVGLDTKL
jgi:hypothetical protein